MNVTKNEIGALISYYIGFKFYLQNKIDTLREDYQGVIDSDLYKTQLNRYKRRLKECDDRINSLQNELDKSNELKKKLNSVYGVNSDKKEYQ